MCLHYIYYTYIYNNIIQVQNAFKKKEKGKTFAFFFLSKYINHFNWKLPKKKKKSPYWAFPGRLVLRSQLRSLSLPWTWIQSLLGELRSHKLRGTARKKKNKSPLWMYIFYFLDFRKNKNCYYYRQDCCLL